MALLEIEELTVEFATASGFFRALDGVSYTIDAGEVMAIVGESGSGKSVAMLALMGLLPDTAKVTAKRMEFAGRDLQTLTPKQRRKIIGGDISMIFQEPIASLNPCFTVEFQLAEALKTHTELSRKERKKKCVELLQAVGLPDPKSKLKAYPHQMSGGQCQRVMIAMAIACEPKLLIADEPTTALDVTIQNQILDLLLDLQNKTGMALIMITHDMGVVAQTADRVVVQYRGDIKEEAPVLDLFANPRHSYTKALLSSLPENATGDRLPAVEDFNEDYAS